MNDDTLNPVLPLNASSNAAMRRSELRYRRLFEAAQDGIVTVDPFSRKITDANPYMTKLLGYTRDEFVGKELWQIGLLKDEEANQGVFRELQDRGFIRYEDLPLESKGGERREVEFVSNLYDEDGQKVIQCNIRDITNRKHAEASLRESRAIMKRSELRFRRLFESTQDGIISLDFATRKITDANPFMTKMLGYTRDELIGRELWQIGLLKDEGASQSAFRELQDRGFIRYEDLPLETKEGERREVEFVSNLYDEDGQKVIQCNVRDITNRKHVEASLRESRVIMKRSELRFRRLFESTQDGIISLDFATRKITDANPFMTKMLGYTRDELIGRELWQIGLLKDEGASQSAFRELQERGFIRYEDLPLETKGGERRDVEFVSNLYDEAGQKVIQCNVRDITDRRVSDAALRNAVDRLRSAQRATERASKAKDEFLAALSHELRTPLTPVLMAVAALREDERIPADVREQFAMMERNIGLEARLIDDLLDLTKVSQGKLQLRIESCDAHNLIGRAIDIVLQDASEKSITIERAFGAQRRFVMIDPTRFQQVIWNLLRNAVKFTPKGGKISIRTGERIDREGENWLRIDVTDSGIGIDPARLEQIFKPFDQGGLTGDHRFGGLGLGLAIARAVTDLHGGSISASSAGVNRGATFVVEMPCALDQPQGVVNTAAGAPAALSTTGVQAAPVSLAILLVEDHDSTLKTLCRLLQREGHRVSTATTIADALDTASLERFDLVISDLGLPDGSGTELMEKLRERHGLRGIALSGYGTHEDICRSHAAGFMVHLLKPVSIVEIRRAIAFLNPVPEAEELAIP
jgi:PAS domain S-box-containing protein